VALAGAVGQYTTFDLLAGFKAAGGVQQGVTVVRTHLITACTTAAPALGSEVIFGLIRGQNTDIGNNIAGAPAPFTDPYEDWMMWEHRVATPGGTTNTFSTTGATGAFAWDIRSKRTFLELQESYNMVLENHTASAVGFTITGSVLVMLP
jgi:hypothetical protein